MFFLIRTAFWLTLVLVLIPIGSGEDTESTAEVNPVEAFVAAQATLSDLSGFCGRNPNACETGSNALVAIGSRARDGARMVYEFLDTSVRQDGTTHELAQMDIAASGEMVTGSIPAANTMATGQMASGTLTPEDLLPAWQEASPAASAFDTPGGPLPRPNPRSGQGA